MINELVASLPEVYQPIFGYPELSFNTSRSCDDRLHLIEKYYDILSKYHSRPLRVLDLGCAQGYISLNLAQKGAIVHGVDYLDKNIAVCNYLKECNKGFNVRFETCLIEDYINKINEDDYDLVLGLSVFHHLVHKYGKDAIKHLIGNLLNKVGAAIFELAVKDEPLYWASSLPNDAKDILSSAAYVNKIGSFSTHLSNIERPFYIASQYYVITSTIVEKFQRVTLEPHSLACGTHEGSRHYFFSDKYFIKQYDFDHPSRGEYNRKEFMTEFDVYSRIPNGFNLIKYKSVEKCNDCAIVVAERIKGDLLLDIINGHIIYDSDDLIKKILWQLVILEDNGLYHSDLRTWNIIIDNDIVYIIDYGSISNNKTDLTWPYNIFLSFFILVNEINLQNVGSPSLHRQFSISPESFDNKYKGWIETIWKLSPNKWSFRFFYDEFLKLIDNREEIYAGLDDNTDHVWMNAVENVINQHSHIDNQLKHRIDEIESASSNHKNDEMKSLKNQLFLSELKNNILASQITVANAELYKYCIDIGKLTNKISYLEFVLENSKKEHLLLVELEASLHKKDLLIKEFEFKNKKSESLSIIVDSKVDRLENANCILEDKVGNLQELIIEKENYIGKLQDRINDLELSINKYQDQLDAKEHDINKRNENIGQIELSHNQCLQYLDDKNVYINKQDEHINRVETSLKESHQEIEKLLIAKQEILNSTSWKISAPIRILKKVSCFPIKIRLTLAHGMKTLLQHSALYISKRKYLRATTLLFLNRVPSLKKRLFNVAINPAWRSNINNLSEELKTPTDRTLLLLDEHELSIYNKLKNALHEN